MHLLGLSNFDSLFDGDVRDDVVREVIEAFAEDDRTEERQAGRLRAEAGYANHNMTNTWTAMGAPVMRVTTDDFWRQQVVHNAKGDPELWQWFLRRPEGEYARVKSQAPRLTVGWRGALRESIRF